MNEEELLEKNNIILSHNKLPKGMTTCENYGLSGNCGIKCPLFKNGTCEVYKDVVERIINNLQSKIDKANEILNKLCIYGYGQVNCRPIKNTTKQEVYNAIYEIKNVLKEDK